MKTSDTARFNFSERSSGILMHLSSLPGIHGSGDLGPGAHHFALQLERAGQTWWQMLPVGPAGSAPSFSPYDSPSAFAGNPLFVSLELLAEEGLLSQDDIRPSQKLSRSGADFSRTKIFREERLLLAFNNFRKKPAGRSSDYRDFCRENEFWLEDFALFMALKDESSGKHWNYWPSDLRKHDASAIQEARIRLSEATDFHKFIQFKFEQQWMALRERCHKLGIGLIGDIPFFTAHDSSDVWSNQELFQLHENGKPRRISGYPPDRFNENGQLWGHPQFEWSNHLKSGFDWWIKRFTRLYCLFDAVRIDHFLGFNRTWSINGGSKTARKGRWVRSPGYELFSALRQKSGQLPMIAEDLGHVTPADIELRKAFNLLPMRIFQFGFGSEPDSKDHLPHNYEFQCAAYTGNHDNNTIKGWFNSLSGTQKKKVCAYTGGNNQSFHLDSIRTLQCSSASLVIFPVQDILGLGAPGRMNVPGTIHGNWKWRLKAPVPTEVIKYIRCQTELFGRLGAEKS